MADAGDFAKGAIEWGFERWHSKSGLVAVLIAVLFLGILTFAGIDIKNISSAEWSIVAAMLVAITVAWFRTRIERAPRKKVGFGVAIEYDDPELGKQLRSDFIVTLRNLLDGSRQRHEFQFISFPQSLTRRVTNEEQARWLARKANLKFLIHGRARLGKTAHGPTQVLDLSWLVKHSQIGFEESAAFKKEATSVFPGRYIFPDAGDMFALEFAAQYVDVAARFVIGIAAAISGDYVYAEQLLGDAETKLSGPCEARGGHAGVGASGSHSAAARGSLSRAHRVAYAGISSQTRPRPIARSRSGRREAARTDAWRLLAPVTEQHGGLHATARCGDSPE